MVENSIMGQIKGSLRKDCASLVFTSNSVLQPLSTE